MNILDKDLSRVRVRRFPAIRIIREPHIFTDSYGFIDWILTNNYGLDVMTYTVGEWHPSLRVNRLIYQIDEHKAARRAAQSVRVDDCHVKLWLLYRPDGKFSFAYVGSLNLVKTTNVNLMERSSYGRLFYDWFNQVWAQLHLPTLSAASVKKGPAVDEAVSSSSGRVTGAANKSTAPRLLRTRPLNDTDD